MELKLTLNMDNNDAQRKQRVEEVRKKVKAASETDEEGFDRIAKTTSLDEKEYELYRVAKEGFLSGEIGRIKDGKITKGEVLSMGAQVLKQREGELKKQRIQDVLDNKPDNFYVLTKDEELEPFLQELRKEVKLQGEQWRDRFEILGVKSLTACDFEGTGIDTYLDLSIGFSIWLPILDKGYYLAYGHVDLNDPNIPRAYAYREGDPQLTRSKVLNSIVPYLSNNEHGKSFHMGSARYDLHIAQNEGYTIEASVWDSLDAMYDMTEHLDSYALKKLVDRYGKRFLGIDKDIYTFEDLFGKRSPAPFGTEIVGIYAIFDVLYGWRLTEWQFETMKKTGNLLEMYAKVDSKIPALDVFMVRCGFEIDLDALKVLEVEFEEKITKAQQEVIEAYEINDQFLYNMSMTLNAKKIQAWKERQQRKVERFKQRRDKAKKTIFECERDGKTHLKKYLNALETSEKAAADLKEARRILAENDVDLFIKTFEFTNNNHIGYLIYDYLKIEDKTYKVDKHKKRSTAAAVLEMYYEDEEALAPLATVAAYEKLLNTYVKKIPLAMEVDGRFHSEFKAGGTSTGRYSSAAYKGRPIDILDEFKGDN